MYSRIKGAVYAKGMKMTDFYKATGFFASTLQRRCEKGKLTVHDVKIIKEALNLSGAEIMSIFFDKELA